MKRTLLILVAAFVSHCAFGQTLKFEAGPKDIEGVNVSKGASFAMGDRAYKLTTVGAGLRSKKVVFVKIKVYVAQLLVADSATFARSQAGALDSLNSLDLMKAAAIQLSFLRDVEADKVQGSFSEALAANDVKTDNSAIRAFLEAVVKGGSAQSGRSITIVGERLPNGSEVITYENTQGQSQSIEGQPGFIRSVFSIWLGKAVDSGVENLKKAIVEGAGL